MARDKFQTTKRVLYSMHFTAEKEAKLFSVKEDFKLTFNPQWLQGVVISGKMP